MSEKYDTNEAIEVLKKFRGSDEEVVKESARELFSAVLEAMNAAGYEIVEQSEEFFCIQFPRGCDKVCFRASDKGVELARSNEGPWQVPEGVIYEPQEKRFYIVDKSVISQIAELAIKLAME